MSKNVISKFENNFPADQAREAERADQNTRIKDGKEERLVRDVWMPVTNLVLDQHEISDINAMLAKHAIYRAQNPLGH